MILNILVLFLEQGSGATYVLDWPPGGAVNLSISTPGVLQNAIVQFLEEVVHPYHISDDHDNIDYRLLVRRWKGSGFKSCLGRSLWRISEARNGYKTGYLNGQREISS